MDVNVLRVRDVMQKQVKTVSGNIALTEAVKMMRDNNLSSLIVEPEDDADTFGIITRKDLIGHLIESTISETSDVVEDVMTKPAITVNMEFSIYNCHQLMRMVGARRLPVTNGSALVGIISNYDIFEKLTEGIPG